MTRSGEEIGTAGPHGSRRAERRSRGAARLAWATAALVVVLGSATLWLVGQNGMGTAGQVSFMLPFLSFAPIAAIVAARRPRNPIGWMLLAIPTVAILYASGQQYAVYGLVTAPGSLPGAAFVAWARLGLWVPVALAFIVWLPLLYPDGRPLSRWWWPVGWVPTAVMGLAVLAVQLTSWPERGVGLLALAAEEAQLVTAADAIFDVAFPVVILGGVAAWTSLVLRYRRGGWGERLQIRWLAFALAIFLVALILSMSLPGGLLTEVLPALAVPMVPASIAVAILRYRLYEIDRILNRAVVYAVVTAVLAGSYAVLVVVLQQMLSPLTEGSDLAVAGSTLVVAAAFGPLRRRVRRAVDRRFNRRRYDAARIVEAFAAHLRDELDLGALRDELGQVVAGTMAPRHVSVWVRW